MPSRDEVIEAIARSIPNVEDSEESSLYSPLYSPLDVTDEWWTTPRIMATHIVDHIKPGFLNIEATDAD